MSTSPEVAERIESGSNAREPRRSDLHLNNWLHPTWCSFIRFCEELQYGEIERLKVQDGLPVLAEVTKKKVKFSS
jgi:hypothetical protein